MEQPRLRFTIGQMMVMVVIAAILLAVVCIGITALDDVDRRLAAYHNGPHEFRLGIGQTVVTFSKDKSPIPIKSHPEGTIPAGTQCIVVEETKGDRDDLTSNRYVSIRLKWGDTQGPTVYVERKYLRVPSDHLHPDQPGRNE